MTLDPQLQERLERAIEDNYRERLAELNKKLHEAVMAKNVAYGERDLLLAVLSKLVWTNSTTEWSAVGLRDDPAATEDAWRRVLFIDLPTGQVSWHIHESELHWFEHLVEYAGVWDGHTTAEKNARLLAYLKR